MSVSKQHTQGKKVDQDRRAGVLLTTYFGGRVAEIGRFWRCLGTPPVFDRVIELIRHDVIPTLERDPEAGQRLHDESLHSDDETPTPEPLADMLRDRKSPCSDVFQYSFGDEVTGQYRILYLVSGESIHLLSIRHLQD